MNLTNFGIFNFKFQYQLKCCLLQDSLWTGTSLCIVLTSSQHSTLLTKVQKVQKNSSHQKGVEMQCKQFNNQSAYVKCDQTPCLLSGRTLYINLVTVSGPQGQAHRCFLTQVIHAMVRQSSRNIFKRPALLVTTQCSAVLYK